MANSLEICRICLRVNIRNFKLRNTNLESMYKLLTQANVHIDDGKPSTVCFLCYTRLLQCEKLQQQAIKSNETLEQLLRGGNMQDTTNAILNNLNTSDGLQVSSMYHVDLKPASCKDVLLHSDNEICSLISVKVEEVVTDEERINLDSGFSQHTNDLNGLEEVISLDSDDDEQLIAIDSNKSDGVQDIAHSLEQTKEKDSSKDANDPNDFAADSEDNQVLIEIGSNQCDAIAQRMKERKQQEKDHLCQVQSESIQEIKNTSPRFNSTKIHGQKGKGFKNNNDAKEIRILKKTEESSVTKKRKSQNSIDKKTKKNPFVLKKQKSQKSSNIQSPLTNKDTHNTITEVFQCNECCKQFTTKDLLTVHILNCIKTTKTLPSNNQVMQKDVLKSLVSEIYRCNICSFKTDYKHYIETHLKMHTVAKVFSCHICNYRCEYRGNLNTHLRTHTGEKPFACDTCGYRCRRKDYLKIHIRTHTGEHPFACNICEFTCAHKPNLRDHMRTHTGEKPFSCRLCNYKCALKVSLKRHVRTHTGEKPFSCNVCKYRCALKHHLKIHMTRHTSDYPLSCNICVYRYKKESALEKHLRTHI